MEFLKQPLVTEDGFINEACLNELEAAIKNMPETYDRLADDPEWSIKRCTSFREITSALAYYATSQFSEDAASPAFAPGLESVLSFLTACIRPKFDENGYAELSLCDINKMCWDVLKDLQQFQDWNKREKLGDYWLDLSALLHNVCLMIRLHRRDYDRFDEKFKTDNAVGN